MKCRRCGKEIENGKSYYGFCSYHCYSLWRKFHKEPNWFKPMVIRWYERAEFEIPKTEAKRVYEPSKEELSKWGL